MTLALTSNLSSLALPTARGGSSSAGTNGAAGRDDARLKDALTALQSLKRPASKASEEQKAAAAKKVEALKARIKMLRMSSGNPASTAKAVAALARELGAAVKAYAAAGGGSAAVGLQSTATPGPQDTASAEAAEDAEASAEATDETEAEPGEGERTPAAAHPSDPYRKAQERLQADAAERARQNGSQEADAKFAAEAKGLAAELKAMLREAQQKAKRTGDDRAMSADQRTADKALDQVTDAVADLTSPIGSVGVGLSINV